MMSLPGLLNPSFDDCPVPISLNVPAQALEKARHALGPSVHGKVKIGIVWSGSVTFGNNRNRSISLERFLPLAENSRLQLYSLQKGPCAADISRLGAEPLVIDLDPYISDFADTAAFIRLLDLVIMTDSSVAHLCGTLNRPVWNLLQFVPYWLYGSEPAGTAWYPSMRLFRQPRPGDWDPVFQAVMRELECFEVRES